MNKRAIFIIIILNLTLASIFSEVLDTDSWNKDGRYSIHYSNEGIEFGNMSIAYDDGGAIYPDAVRKPRPAGYIYIPMEIAKKGMKFQLSDNYNLASRIDYRGSWIPAFVAPFVGGGKWLRKNSDTYEENSPYHATTILFLSAEDYGFDQVEIRTKYNLNRIYKIGTSSSDDIKVSSNDAGYLKIKVEIRVLRYKEDNNFGAYGNPYFNFPWKKWRNLVDVDGVIDTSVNVNFFEYGDLNFDIYHYTTYRKMEIPPTSCNLTLYDKKYSTSESGFDISDPSFRLSSPLNNINKIHSVVVEHNYSGNYKTYAPPKVNVEIEYDGILKNPSNNKTIDYNLYLSPVDGNGFEVPKNKPVDITNDLVFKKSQEFGPNIKEYANSTIYSRADADLHVKVKGLANKLLSGKYKATIKYKMIVN